MQVRTVSTFVDWTYHGGCWGRVGVHRIFDFLQLAGIKDVYWRVTNGGTAMYPSKIAQVQDSFCYYEAQRMNTYPSATTIVEHYKDIDFNSYDPLKDAVEFARETGIRLHFWYTLFEDDHGGYVLSKFAREHPEYWQMDREGRQYRGTLDWFYDEVKDYKLAIIDELLSYGADGLMLDFVRHNGCPSADKNGVHRLGYNPEIRERYRSLHGVDPIDLPSDNADWLSFKQATMTSVIREIKQRMNKTETFKELSLMLWPVDYAKWACIDVPLLTSEEIVQMLCGFSIKYTFQPQEAVDQYNILKSQTRSENVKILPGICCDNGNYPSHVNDFIEAAKGAGAQEVMLHEADKLANSNMAPTIRAVNLGVPNYERVLTARRAASADQIDWAAIPEYSDFLFNSGKGQKDVPSESTRVQIVYTPSELILKFSCSDSQMDIAMSPVEEQPAVQYYLDTLGSRTYAFYLNSFNVFLDSQHCHQDYYHFAVTPSGDQAQETFVKDDWNGEWDSCVETRPDGWDGIMRIPYESMGVCAPKPGERWGINLLRGIRAEEETSIWFYIIWSLPYADDMGHLEFG